MTIKDVLDNFIPYNEQEATDKEYFLYCEKMGNILTRENLVCHLTASAFVLNRTHNKVLCAFHNIFKSFGWLGGHADGMEDLLAVAQKETFEESGLKNIKLLLDNPISIDALSVEGHIKNGHYVSAHTHLNVCFLFEADENADIRIKPDENSDIKWISFDELLLGAWEPQMKKVYGKIIEKIAKFLN